ncbi:MAG: tRNA guanosine(34) transglycosylase Tgt [Planctomycetota bacterium]|nr:tRNA guanosine(34) transglycosylase Tgt [Planctomycetota bacterium]
MSFFFELHSVSGKARTGLARTVHGEFETPAFMPVATLAALKGVTTGQLAETGSEILLTNAYHLHLRPGEDVVRDMGGLHRFMDWDGPLLTDSGGYQVFSLANIRDVTDEGVSFRSHIDGRQIFIGPREATRIQNALGADIAMAFDECPSPTAKREIVARAVRRTVEWAKVCLDAHDNEEQTLFGIVQGGAYEDMRSDCAKQLVQLPFGGFAIGGLGIGEGTEALLQMVETTLEHLPSGKPRYLMGLGRPDDIVRCIALGVDMFDCVVPTRNARNAMLFTDDGPLRMKNASHIRDERPVMAECDCYTCRTVSRAYLRHLYVAGEHLAGVLGSIHNIHYYQSLVRRCRKSIEEGCFDDFLRIWLRRYNGPNSSEG